jgi:hypothetical protein
MKEIIMTIRNYMVKGSIDYLGKIESANVGNSRIRVQMQMGVPGIDARGIRLQVVITMVRID